MDTPLTIAPKIAFWNDNGLAHHTNEIKLFLDINKKMYFSGQRLILHRYRSYFNVKHYSIYCSNHSDNTDHVRCAVLIKTSIKHYMLPSVQFIAN